MFDKFIEDKILEVRAMLIEVEDYQNELNIITEEHEQYKHIDLRIITLNTKIMHIVHDLEEFFNSKFSGAIGLKKLFELFKAEYGFDEINDEPKETPKTAKKKR